MKDPDSPWRKFQTITPVEKSKKEQKAVATNKTQKVNKGLKAVVTGLHSNTHYYFRVKSVNRNIKEHDINGAYSKIIEEETRFNLAEKVLLTPAAAAAGAVASPVVGAALAAGGVWVGVEPENPATKGLTGAASVVAGAAGALAGVVGAPVGAVVGAVALYLDGYESPWSDDDPKP